MKSYLSINLICCISLLFIIMNCTNTPEPTPQESDKNIIHVEEEWVQPPPNFDTIMLSSITEFNKKGKSVEKSQYSKYDGSLIIFTKWAYDDHDNIIEKITNNKEANILLQDRYTYEYDKKGRKAKMVEKSSNGASNEIKHVYVYHKDGTYTDTIKARSQLLSIIHYNEDDKIIDGNDIQKKSHLLNEYDDRGNTIKRTKVYSEGPNNEVTYTNEYDSFGNLIRKTLDHRYRAYEYNENGDVIKETRMDKEQPTLIIIYKYKYYE